MTDRSPSNQDAKAAGKTARPVIPLSMVEVDEEVLVASVQGGRGLVHRLAEMGVFPGTRLRVLSKGRAGPFIVSINRTRLVFGQGLVARMSVRAT